MKTVALQLKRKLYEKENATESEKRKKSNDHSTKTTPTPQIISDSSDTQSYAEVTSGKNNTVEDLMTAVTSFVKKAERALPEPDLNHEVQA